MSKEIKPFYEFGPFRFYTEDLVLLCNERNLGLSGKPMDVFFVLFEKRGEPVSKPELLKAVWGKDGGDVRNLYRAIATLKKSLRECDDRNEYIETLRESGYRFVAEVREGPTNDTSADKQSSLNDLEISIRDEYGVPSSSTEIENQILSPVISSFTRLHKTRLVIAVLVLLAALAAALLYFRDSCKPKEKPSVVMNPDGSWTALVPVIKDGVKLEKAGQRFEVREGEEILVDATGFVDIGRGLFGPDGDMSSPDRTMDSPIKDHVGGLELWIGFDKNSRHYFVGSQRNQVIRIEESGVPTFRVIESLNGYCDKNNSGYFTVTVRKLHDTGNN